MTCPPPLQLSVVLPTAQTKIVNLSCRPELRLTALPTSLFAFRASTPTQQRNKWVRRQTKGDMHVILHAKLLLSTHCGAS